MYRVGFPCSSQRSGEPCPSGVAEGDFDALEARVTQNETDISQNETDVAQNAADILVNADAISLFKHGILIVDTDPDFNLSENENITIWYNRTEEKLKVRDGCEIYAVTLTLDRDWCYYYTAEV